MPTYSCCFRQWPGTNGDRPLTVPENHSGISWMQNLPCRNHESFDSHSSGMWTHFAHAVCFCPPEVFYNRLTNLAGVHMRKVKILRPRRNVCIVQRIFFKLHFTHQNYCILILIPLTLVFYIMPCMPTSAWIMAWRLVGYKPLSKPVKAYYWGI